MMIYNPNIFFDALIDDGGKSSLKAYKDGLESSLKLDFDEVYISFIIVHQSSSIII